MQIERMMVENFRCLRAATLDCTPLTALVGRNGAGKSTFLAALDKFFDPTARVVSEDFFGRDTATPITIRVTFRRLKQEELDAFAAYLEGATLTVTKRFNLPGNTTSTTGRYFATRWRFVPFNAVRAAGKVDEMKEAFALLIQSGTIPTNAKASTKTAMNDYMDDFEANNPGLLEQVEDETQFFGEKNVGGGKLDSFTRFVYIPAVRDVMQETGEKKTSLAVLLESAVLQKVTARIEVAELPGKVAELVRRVYDPAKLDSDLCDLSADLNRTLQSFVSDAAVELRWGEPRIPTFEAPPVIPSVVEDNFPGDPSHKGHGLQRALIFTLLAHRQRMQAPRSVEAQASPSEPDLIMGIEEPELYQHPTRCRHIADVLADLTSPTAQPRTQVLYTTHSPYFVAIDRFEDVRIVRKRPTSGSIPATAVFCATWNALRHRWAACCELPEEKVTIQSLVSRALPSMSALTNEGYFADVAVLVEGAGDATILGEVAHMMSCNWPGKGVAVVPVGGKGNLGAPALILSELGVPTYFVFDGDGRSENRPREARGHAVQNKILLRLGGAEAIEFPPDTVASRFACFSDKTETYCRAELGEKLYTEILQVVAEEIAWLAPEDVLKTERGAKRFVDLVYSKGHTLPLIEKIILAIESLAGGGPTVTATP